MKVKVLVGGWYCFRNSWWVFPKRKVIYLPLPIRCWRFKDHPEKNKDIRCDLTKCVRSYCEIRSEAVLEALTPVGAEVFSYPPPVDIEKVVHRRTEPGLSLCKFSDVSVSLSLSAQSRSVDRSWHRRNTHDQLDERREGLQEETFLMSSILSTFVFLYVSSSRTFFANDQAAKYSKVSSNFFRKDVRTEYCQLMT